MRNKGDVCKEQKFISETVPGKIFRMLGECNELMWALGKQPLSKGNTDLRHPIIFILVLSGKNVLRLLAQYWAQTHFTMDFSTLNLRKIIISEVFVCKVRSGAPTGMPPRAAKTHTQH